MSSPACTLSPVSLCCQEWLKLQNFWLWGRVRSTVLFYSAAKKARFYPAPDGALDFYASHGGVLVRSAPLVGIFTFFPASARRNQFLSATPKTDGGTPRRSRRRRGERRGRWGSAAATGVGCHALGGDAAALFGGCFGEHAGDCDDDEDEEMEGEDCYFSKFKFTNCAPKNKPARRKRPFLFDRRRISPLGRPSRRLHFFR
mmetsp:Transcript_15599/g.37803  ORF Transcript_15599/g.37803 Transcript_15599/m.37803 type:complete len:201 (-) Transcript_15599:1085-1687(-)